LNPCALELRERPQQVQLQAPGWRGRVDPLIQRHETHPQRRQLVQDIEQVLQAAPEAVQTPADDDVELTPPGGLEQVVQGGAAILCAGAPAVDVLPAEGPAARLQVAAQLVNLVVHILVEGADPGVESGSQSVGSLCAGLNRRGVVNERVIR